MSVYILRNEDIKKRCIEEIESLYQPMQVKITKQKRSNDQNAYWHKLVDVISSFTGDDPEEMKVRLKYEMVPLREIDVKGVKHLYPISTTELNKEQFSLLIEKTLFVGHQLGLTMPLASHYGLVEINV